MNGPTIKQFNVRFDQKREETVKTCLVKQKERNIEQVTALNKNKTKKKERDLVKNISFTNWKKIHFSD